MVTAWLTPRGVVFIYLFIYLFILFIMSLLRDPRSPEAYDSGVLITQNGLHYNNSDEEPTWESTCAHDH